MSYVTESDIRVKSYEHSNLSRAFFILFRASRYIMFPNRTSEWNFVTIWISRVLPLFNFERLHFLCRRIRHRIEMLWPFEYVKIFRCSISSVSIYYVPESDIRVKSYDHSNFSRASVVQFLVSRWVMSANRTSVWKAMTIRISSASVVQFRASRYIISPNRTSEWNFMAIRISRELPLFNFERLDELCPRIGHPVKS